MSDVRILSNGLVCRRWSAVDDLIEGCWDHQAESVIGNRQEQQERNGGMPARKDDARDDRREGNVGRARNRHRPAAAQLRGADGGRESDLNERGRDHATDRGGKRRHRWTRGSERPPGNVASNTSSPPVRRRTPCRRHSPEIQWMRQAVVAAEMQIGPRHGHERPEKKQQRVVEDEACMFDDPYQDSVSAFCFARS